MFCFLFLVYKTIKFHVAVRLFSNRSRKMSKCVKDISDTLGYRLCATLLSLPHFDVKRFDKNLWPLKSDHLRNTVSLLFLKSCCKLMHRIPNKSKKQHMMFASLPFVYSALS